MLSNAVMLWCMQQHNLPVTQAKQNTASIWGGVPFQVEDPTASL